MNIYRIVNEATQEVLPDPIFNSGDAIKQADALAKKLKTDFRVVSLVPVYSTKAKADQKDIEF